MPACLTSLPCSAFHGVRKVQKWIMLCLGQLRSKHYYRDLGTGAKIAKPYWEAVKTIVSQFNNKEVWNCHHLFTACGHADTKKCSIISSFGSIFINILFDRSSFISDNRIDWYNDSFYKRIKKCWESCLSAHIASTRAQIGYNAKISAVYEVPFSSNVRIQMVSNVMQCIALIRGLNLLCSSSQYDMDMVVSVIYSLYLKGEFQNITKTALPTYLYLYVGIYH